MCLQNLTVWTTDREVRNVNMRLGGNPVAVTTESVISDGMIPTYAIRH